MNTAIPLLLTVALSAGGAADEHLLAGARHFADARYEHALVEFQVAQRLGSAEGAAYAGATLVELERWEDAVEAFGAAPPPGADSLLVPARATARACTSAPTRSLLGWEIGAGRGSPRTPRRCGPRSRSSSRASRRRPGSTGMPRGAPHRVHRGV